MKKHRWLTRGDFDGFCGLFVDNLMQLMLISVLCRYVCGFESAFIAGRILPGAALSILVGNIFYSWQARRLAEQTGRYDVTALPFGLNTISLLGFIFLVMSPVYYDTGDAELAWRVGLAACILSGVIETAGAFVGGWIRKHTPRAALLSGLGGVALSFMVLGFSFQIFASPLVSLVPALLFIIIYAARLRLPGRIPGGAAAIALGVAMAWFLKWTGLWQFNPPSDPIALGLHIPKPALGDLIAIFSSRSGWEYIAVVVPIALFNVIGSIENLESAEAAGDKFESKPALLVNGFTSLLAGVLGSPFPTTIYIGHPGWKAMGARTSYSVLSGSALLLLCITGGVSAVLKVVPVEATLGILMWIGLVIVAEAFVQTERRYALAVVIGFIPPLAAWVLHILETTLRAAGTDLYSAMDKFGGEIYLDGVLSLYQGFLVSSILLASIVANVMDRDFKRAAAWSFLAAALSATGLIHAYVLTPDGIRNSFGWMAAPWFVTAYAMIGLFLLACRYFRHDDAKDVWG